MNDPDLSGILNDLASGRIDAAEAARRIEAVRSAASGPADAEPEPVLPSAPTGVKGTDRVSIRAVGRRVRVVGDPAVATASVDGEHVLRRQGGVLEISSDGDLGPKLEGLGVLRPPRSLDDLKGISLTRGLTVRVNPAIEVDIELTAGSLHVNGVPFLGRVRVTAGGVQVTGVRRVTDALVQAGSATIAGPVAVGRSRIKVESGSLQLRLEKGAHVVVHADAQVGRIQWPGEVGQVDELSVGNGSARLDVEVVMGVAQITKDEDA